MNIDILIKRKLVVSVSATVLFTACLISGCTSKLSSEDYIKWVRDYKNNLHVQSSVSDFVFDLQYQPSPYVLLQRGIKTSGDAAIAAELQKISLIQYYTLTISSKNSADLMRHISNDQADQQQKQYYLSYRFQDDITLEENGEVLPCILFHAERPASVNGGRTFLLGFENRNNTKEAKVVIRCDLFSALPVKIKIGKSNIPHVAL